MVNWLNEFVHVKHEDHHHTHMWMGDKKAWMHETLCGNVSFGLGIIARPWITRRRENSPLGSLA